MEQESNIQDPNATPKGGMKEASASDERKIESYASALISVVYNKKTGASIVEMLKGAPPEKSIPQVVLQVNGMVEDSARRGDGENPSLGVLLNSNMLLIKELLDVGEAGGFFQLEGEQVKQVLQSTMQRYIENGLKNKTIDPVELQREVEPLMDETQSAEGMAAGQATGVPQQAGVEAAMETHATSAVERERGMVATGAAGKANQAQGQQQQGAMQQAQAQPQQGGN